MTEKEILSQLCDAFAKLEEKNERVSKIYTSNLTDNIIIAGKSINCLDEFGENKTIWGAYLIKDSSIPHNIIRVKSEDGYSFDFEVKEPKEPLEVEL